MKFLKDLSAFLLFFIILYLLMSIMYFTDKNDIDLRTFFSLKIAGICLIVSFIFIFINNIIKKVGIKS